MDSERPQLASASPFNAVLILLGLFVSVILGINQTLPPKAGRATVPLSDFSSVRAMTHVREIAVKPHPSGSSENERVRRYIVDQLTALGFRPDIQSTYVKESKRGYTGWILNIAVRIPGSRTGKAVLVSAHYDSVPAGPGAADDAASVAVMLETLRALTASPPLRNDLIFLFTDGEEYGLLGADAFVAEHPWSADAGLALNFEYRGNCGAFMMFETSEGNGQLVRALADAVPFVQANSLMFEVYKRLPNDTDLTVFKRAGIPGMNFAAIDGLEVYHTALDRPERLDRDTLQHEGDIMLRLTRYFGNRSTDDLNEHDRIYFDFPGLGVVHYPASWSVFLNTLLLMIYVSLLAYARRKNDVSIARVLAASAVYAFTLLGLVIFNQLVWIALSLLKSGYPGLFHGAIRTSPWILAGFIALSAGIFRLIQFCMSRWFRMLENSLGIMVVWLILSTLTAVWWAGASFLLIWPLAAMMIVLALTCFYVTRFRPEEVPVPVLLGSIPGVVLYTQLIMSIYTALTASMISVVIFFLALVLGLLNTLISILGYRRLFVSLCFLSSFAAFTIGLIR